MSHRSSRTSSCVEDESPPTDQAGNDTFTLKFLEGSVDCHLADPKPFRPLPFRRQRVSRLQAILADELADDLRKSRRTGKHGVLQFFILTISRKF